MEDETSADIGAVLLGDMDPERAIDRAAVRTAVQHQIFCPYTNALLDVRTAVLIEMHSDEKLASMEVVDFQYWKKIGDKTRARCEKLGITLKVYNGKELFR
ncbi:hypothetical protein [Microbispora sp. NPDC049633]|uniref:hypothetical protein n=1 Tax=Microbispora sp. NPDC049633 TaxID=3154355 RepID=UPI00342A86CF